MKNLNIFVLMLFCIFLLCGCSDRKDVGHYFEQGKKNFKNRDLSSAIDSFKKVIDIYPGYQKAHYKVGLIYFQLHEHDEAIPYFEQAIELDNTDLRAYHLLGECLMYTGNLKRAEEIQQKEIKFAKGLVGLGLLSLISIYELQGDYDLAIEHARKAMELHTPNKLEYCQLGTLHFKAGHYQEAIDALENARGLEENFPDIYFTRAMSYLNLGQKDKAQQEYEQLKKHDQILSKELLRKISQTN